MTNKQILKKAIEQAKENGYKHIYVRDFFAKFFASGEDYKYSHLYYAIIFSHDFAKAFWGEHRVMYEICGKQYEENEDMHNDDCNDWDCKQAEYTGGWQSHLSEMVLVEEPLKYIEKFLK